MAKVTVYQVNFYNIQSDEMMRSRRWFTRAGADRVKGIVLENTTTEIEEANLEAGEQWTPRGFDPHAVSGGFQRQVL